MKPAERLQGLRAKSRKVFFSGGLIVLVASSLLPHRQIGSAASAQGTPQTVPTYASRSAHGSPLCPGSTIKYSVQVDNESVSTEPTQQLDLQAQLDPATSYVAGSGPSSAVYNAVDHTLQWSQQLAPADSTELAFSVTVNSGTALGDKIELNTSGSLGGQSIDTLVIDTVTCGNQVFIPMVGFSAVTPVGIHKLRAAQIIEDARNTEGAPGWENAALDGTVQALYRPDVSGVAYYEFGVAPQGFIVVSTGEHDMMAPHWNYLGTPPTVGLKQYAQANNQTAVKFYKLDALVYAAENASGELVSDSTKLPAKISGLDPRSLDQVATLTERESAPATPILDDANATGVERITRTSGPVTDTVEYSAWASWQELKTGFRASYGVLLDSLGRDAAKQWASVRSEEGIRVGETRQLALADPATTFQLRGANAASVRLTRRERAGLPPVLDLEVLGNPVSGVRTPFEVVLSVPSGGTETMRYFIMDPIPQLKGIQGSWSNWSTYVAGTEADQRNYDQFTISGGCASGCGPTAWAMLFGWADNQAAKGNPTWVKRWGIYRVNGGYGANAVAPVKNDSGIEAMMLEIRNHVDTFCINGQGATTPQKMDQANRYLKDRSGIRVSTHYNVFIVPQQRLRIYARNSIIDRDTPVIIGTGHLAISHYPLAWKYRSRTRSGWGANLDAQFYVNKGWNNPGENGWVAASTWFAGEIYPN